MFIYSMMEKDVEGKKGKESIRMVTILLVSLLPFSIRKMLISVL